MTFNTRALSASTTKLSTSLIGLILCAMASTAAAETRYVSDDLSITLRSGQSTQHQILKSLSSGTPLEVLETNDESGYTRVRTPQGLEGWVITRFLMDHPGAQDQLADATKKLARLEEENKDLKSKLSSVSGDKNSLDKDKRTLLAKTDKLQSDLDHVRKTAANALAIEKEKDRLAEENRGLQSKIQLVEEQNADLKDRSNREWFVRGAGVVIAGIILGLILPKMRFRRRSNWNTLE